MRGDSKEFVTVKATPEALPDILERAKETGADLVIIDTVPHTDKAALIAANNADFVLVPCRTSAFDLKALPATFDLLNLSKTKAAIVLNNAPPVGNLAVETAKHLQDNGYIVSPVVISQRVAFSHAVSDGRAVHEYEPEGKAAAEISALWDSLKEEIG
jgi:chromosome partitioning protein